MSKYDRERQIVEQIDELLGEAMSLLDEGFPGLIVHPQVEELDKRLNRVRRGIGEARVGGCAWFLRTLKQGATDE